MKVLVACEYSGVVSSAFRAKGHDAYSCDIIPGDIPKFHLQMDLFDAVSRIKPDLLIAHPPCTYLCKAQIFRVLRSYDRLQEAVKSAIFVKKILSLDIPLIAVENPIGLLSTVFRKPDQIVYAYNFGDSHSKDICLWLKNLPPLINTCHNPRKRSVSNHVNGRMSRAEKSKIKSKFFPLVAEAMANQWTEKYL